MKTAQEFFDQIYFVGICCLDCQYKTTHADYEDGHRIQTRGCAFENTPEQCPVVARRLDKQEEEYEEEGELEEEGEE